MHRGQQVAAGDVMLVIEAAADDAAHGTERRERLDPARAGRSAGAAVQGGRRRAAGIAGSRGGRPRPIPRIAAAAIDAAREEIRRVLLGYDANPTRAESSRRLPRGPASRDLSESFRRELAEIRHELTTFADVEELFDPRAARVGLGRARVRRTARGCACTCAASRPKARGSTSEFLGSRRRALSHYGVASLTPTDALRRAVLRLLSCQARRISATGSCSACCAGSPTLAQAGIYLGDDKRAGERAPPDRAHAAAGDRRRRRRRPRGDLRHLPASRASKSAPARTSLRGGALARRGPRSSSTRRRPACCSRSPRRRGSSSSASAAGFVAGRSRRREIALAAHIQRRYCAAHPDRLSHRRVDERAASTASSIRESGLVLAGTARSEEILGSIERLCRAAPPDRRARAEDADPRARGRDSAGSARSTARRSARRSSRLLGREGPSCRVTLGRCSAARAGSITSSRPGSGSSGGLELRSTTICIPRPRRASTSSATRTFDLERLQSEEGIYAFHGRADERARRRARLRARRRARSLARAGPRALPPPARPSSASSTARRDGCARSSRSAIRGAGCSGIGSRSSSRRRSSSSPRSRTTSPAASRRRPGISAREGRRPAESARPRDDPTHPAQPYELVISDYRRAARARVARAARRAAAAGAGLRAQGGGRAPIAG